MNKTTSDYRIRVGAVALAIAAILLALYLATRPYSDELALRGAQAYASTAWIISHVIGMLGFIGLAIGLTGQARQMSAAAAASRSAA